MKPGRSVSTSCPALKCTRWSKPARGFTFATDCRCCRWRAEPLLIMEPLRLELPSPADESCAWRWSWSEDNALADPPSGSLGSSMWWQAWATIDSGDSPYCIVCIVHVAEK